MLKNTQDQILIRSEVAIELTPELELHSRCGVYTAADQVSAVLDAVGWTAAQDLSESALLEPSAGDGAFVTAAIDRLLRSLRRHGHPLTCEILIGRICAFELVEEEAMLARAAASALLAKAGLTTRSANRVSKNWVRTADFLLWPADRHFTHVVGNPPYCRWSRVPKFLKARYEEVLPKSVAKGDIFLPFLDKSIGLLASNGLLGFVCSDRWKFMGFAEEFRTERMPQVRILQDLKLDGSKAFQRSVDAYSSLLVLERAKKSAPVVKSLKRPRTLADAGFRVKVGPALGCTSAFVLNKGETDVERKLLHRFVVGSDIVDGTIIWSGRRVVVMHDEEGRLVDLDRFPKALKRFRLHRQQLAERAIVRTANAKWYAPIDRVRKIDWSSPKLLVPELARVPRFALDETGGIPSHGIYAVFAPSPSALLELRDFWTEKGLANILRGKTPKVKGGYVRCYKRFLDASPAPT